MTAPDRRWAGVFRFKGAWNCVVSAGLLFADDAVRAWLGMAAAEPMYRTLFLLLAFCFGVGYWQVGGDLAANRAVVWMGVIGQAGVFVVVVGHYLRGEVHAAYLGPAVVDLAFAVLFLVFLLQTRRPRR